MPRKAREILKAQGYTDEELNGVALLNDPKFTSALEKEEAERERLAAEFKKAEDSLAATTTWYHKEAVPTLNKALADAVQAKAERARLESQLKSEQEYGLRKAAAQDENPNPNPNPNANPNPGNFDQYDQRYINKDTFQAAFAQTGDAIAMAADFLEDYRDLFGKKLPGGLGALRQKYLQARETGFNGTIRDFGEREFGFESRRTEMAQKERDDHDNKIRQEERMKVLSEQANPMLRTPESSRSPFMRAAIKSGTTDGKQPWERGTVEQRRGERVVKFGTKVMTGNQAG